MTDTGPPYPVPAIPNKPDEIDSYIRVNGTLPPFDWRHTVISQYANSPILNQILENIAGYLDQTANFQAFYDLIWNLDTAQGYGLDVWGRIVGVNRVLQVVNASFFGFAEAQPGSQPFNKATVSLGVSFGFAEAQPSSVPLGQAPFGIHPIYSDSGNPGAYSPFYAGVGLTSNYALSDQAYRKLIYVKAAYNITDGSIPAINAILLSLFPGRGNCYVTEVTPPSFFGFAESHNAAPFGQSTFYAGEILSWMGMTYTFKFALTPVELAIVEQSGVLPRPTGVQATTIIAP